MEERDIERLIHRWSAALDENDWNGVEACLAEQFTLSAPPVITTATPQPRAQVVAGIAARNGRYGAFHGAIPGLVTVDGDMAQVLARIIGGHWTKDRTAWEVGYGFYDLAIVREDGAWRIASLTLRMTFSQGPGLLDQMAAEEHE